MNNVLSAVQKANTFVMQISEVGVQITAEMGPLNATDIFCSSDPSQMMSKALSAEGNGKSIVVDS